MERREFIKLLGTGALGVVLSGCGLRSYGDVSQAAVGQTAAETVQEGVKKMKITVITGSSNSRGTSFLLAEKFIEGARQAGHEVFRFDAALEDIRPCSGCNRCRMNGPCIYNDSIAQKLTPHILAADMIALVTPLYYFGMSAQLKTALDRFHANGRQLVGSDKRTVLMATAHGSQIEVMDALVHHYRAWAQYHRWVDAGMVLAVGCGSRSLIENSKYPEEAYQLGMRL